MQKEDFYFELPKELIAQTPLLHREDSKLLVVHKDSDEIEHRVFKDILNYIEEGDCVVLNNTKVIPARLIGCRANTGAEVELLLLRRIDGVQWETLVYPGKKAKKGDYLYFGGGKLTAEIQEVLEDGNRLVSFKYDGIFEEILDEIGEMPLPPYITQKLQQKDRYQTVYAKHDGSAAAPTAGLHFTKELLHKLKDKNVNIANITLHVGLGTFRPVKVKNVLEHKMHSEYYQVEQSQADIINKTKQSGKKIIAVGTTSCRTLEALSDEKGQVMAGSGFTDIFIYPYYKFKVVDSLITNFHLPESTLIMLVAALYGTERTLNAYKTAVNEKYRFFSFGDAMFIKG